MVISELTAPVPARYRLIEEVGQGGMAVVYRAMDDSLKRDVAIKVLHRHLSAEPESKARLEREAQAVAKLRHDNILEIFDYSGVDAASAYIVTELIDGETLKKFLGQTGIVHPEVAVLIAAELCGALAHAHGMGIIHRDIKPENVMIRNDGLLKLMDFGIAQVLDLERMTVTGQLLGSPAYMAPELVEGKPLDVRTDIFSVGILLYQMATGVLPFSGKNPHEVLRRITDGRFPDPRGLNRLVSTGLARIIAHALARNPDDRYPDMATFLVDLREQLADAGLGVPRAELAAYFADPAGFEKALPERMTPALMATAARHMATRNAGRAIECWNRVLAYAPDHPDVSLALRRFEGRGRRRRAALVGGSVLGTAGLLVAVGLLGASRSGKHPVRAVGAGASATRAADTRPAGAGAAPTGPDEAETSPAGTGLRTSPGSPVDRAGLVPGLESSRTVPAPTGQGEHGGSSPHAARGRTTDRTSGEGETPRASVRSPSAGPGADRAHPAGAPAMRVFALGPTPQNVDVYLDGERQFAYDTDHRTLTVPWNATHQIEFRSPSGCCFVERVEIGPDKPEPPENVIARRLKWRPARLIVTTQPAAPGVRIMVRDPARPERGSVVGPGEETNIPFLATDEAQKEVEVSVDSAAGMFAERVVIRAGEHKAVVVSLEHPTRQVGP